jgi:hypothetical protein
MLKTLLWKELRETLGIAAAALVVYALFVSAEMGHSLLPVFNSRGTTSVPFVGDEFVPMFCFVSAGLAIALGLWQTAVESGRSTWLFLLHRPMGWRQLIGMKLAVGAAVYLVCAALPILAYAWWAATPETHPNPFYWWMTVWAWKAWIAIGIVYLGAFLSGIRPGRWIGTRLVPLAATAILAPLIALIPWWRYLGWPALILGIAWLLALIFFMARTRDFS